MKSLDGNRQATTRFAVKALSIAIGSALCIHTANGQDAGAESADQGNKQVEEVVVLGRLRSAAEDVVGQRLESEVSVDILNSELIGRIGDSTVADALRRLPGVTTVDDKFVFVRGLGERYSKTLLNGAEVPSPDLSRSVIPLDLFPTSIVENLVVQKGYTSRLPSQFAGGTVDIRTRSVPDHLVFSVQLGTGYNSESSGDFLSYSGGSDDDFGEDDGTRGLSPDIVAGLNQFLGDISVAGIRNLPGNSGLSIEEAEVINRQLASSLFRDFGVQEDSGDIDLDGALSFGNRWYFDNGVEFGFLSGASYDRSWRNADIIERQVTNQEEFVSFEQESTFNVNLNGNLGFGLRLNDDNIISTNSIFLRNTEDEVGISDQFGNDGNNELSGGAGDREFSLRYEQRELLVNQIQGEHVWNQDIRDLLGLNFLDGLSFVDNLKVTWFFSDSKATTDIPSEISLGNEVTIDPNTLEVLSSTVDAFTDVDYRFTDLEDNVESGGFIVSYPFTVERYDIEVSGGVDSWQKARTYQQFQFNLRSQILAGNPLLSEDFSTIFSDENLNNDALGFEVQVEADNAESYIAASKVDAAFGSVDLTWADTFRFTVGVRKEEYQQVNLAFIPLAFNGPQISTDVDVLNDSVFTTDDTFGSFSAVWMVNDFWAEDFQLRFSFAETTIRPDLRDISTSSYIDPITDTIVFGNPDLIPSSIDNFDLRAEWFFSNGDNFTVTAFYKDIEDPIENFEQPASGTRSAIRIANAESAEITGVEFEFLKNLEFLGEAFYPFFIRGNLTILDHELVAGEDGQFTSDATNNVRGLTGASDYTANLILGFDSNDEKHSATLSYNVFGERLFFAGRLGQPDAFEQTRHTLDLTYSYYPTNKFTLKLSAKNLLDEDLTFQRDGAALDTYVEEKGQTVSLSLKYDF